MIPIKTPLVWLQTDGTLVSCRDKIKVLTDNHIELAQVMQDAFEDAVIIGVDGDVMRGMLRDMVDALDSPKIHD